MTNMPMRLLSYVVMVYMILAFGWWALLLHRNTEDTYQAKRDHLFEVMSHQGLVSNVEQFEKTVAYNELLKKRQSQTRMIIGEASVFIITLLIGLWLINKAYDREIKANKQRRNFLLSITHELKSPIASIRLVLETLLKRELPKKQSDLFLRNALDENERLHNMVGNLLLSARLEGRFKPFMEEMNLVNLIDELIAKQKVKHPEIEFNFVYAENFPLVNLDRHGMWSAINNLIENAIKYSNGGKLVDIQLQQNGGRLFLEIGDQGPGIPISERKRIFEKFYRIGSEETRKTKGTGLGLFIVDQIIKAHKGKILVTDNKPKGTLFKIDLPA